ncbi:MAG TPA: RNA methyltransferase [Bacilli bacterium]|nr:RNA methyltransferase [Bacilli bacterium]
MVYTSIDNDKIKQIKRLQVKKNRDNEGLFLVEGDHLVKEAYDTGLLKTLIVEENYDFNLEVDKIYCSSKVMKYLSELDTPKKVIGVCYKKNNEVTGNKILALDEIQDPGNLGTIIRSAVAFNIDTILLSKTCVDVYNSKVVRASQGMIFHINIVICDLKDTLNKLKDFNIYGTKVTNGVSVKNVNKDSKYVIVMGNEGNGVSKEILDICNNYIYIDMNNKCESLNVAVATLIILYELDRGD